jgi:hypothetical protein
MVIVPLTRKRDLRSLKEPALWTNIAAGYQSQIPWTYLDNEWMWKEQLKNVMNKAYRTFWTVRAHVVKPGV